MILIILPLLFHLFPYVLRRGQRIGQHKLAVDPPAETDPVPVFPLQPRQVVAGLAGIPDIRPHLHHVPENGLDLPAGMQVHDDPKGFCILQHPLGMGPDDLPPDLRGEKQVALGPPVVPIPQNVHARNLVILPDHRDLIIRDGGTQIGHLLRMGIIGHQGLLHPHEQVGTLKQPHPHKAAYQILLPVYPRRRRPGLPYEKLAEQSFLILHRMLMEIRSARQVPGEGLCGKNKAFIDENMERPLRLELLEKELHYFKNHIIHVFKNRYGLTPYTYYTRQRIRLAREYLVNTSMSVEEISLRLQFESPQYFSKCFKKEYGPTPTQYRKLHRG